jgi:hypothetical protein
MGRRVIKIEVEKTSEIKKKGTKEGRGWIICIGR